MVFSTGTEHSLKTLSVPAAEDLVVVFRLFRRKRFAVSGREATSQGRLSTERVWFEDQSLTFPILKSMYLIFTYRYHKNQPNVGKYTIPMDPMGFLWVAYPFNYCPKLWNNNSWNQVSSDQVGAYHPCSTKPAECQDS